MRGLAQTLVLTGAVRAAEMSAAIAQVGEGPELEQLLVSSKMVTETQVAQAIALHTGHRYVDLSSMPLDPSVVALVPGNLCRRFQLIPIDRRGDRLTVGILDPTDIVALDDVASVTDLFVEPVVVAQDALAQMFERFLRSDEELSELSSTIEESAESSQASMTETLEEQDNDAPDRALRQSADRSGDQRPCERHPRRAWRAAAHGAVPHRRRAARDAEGRPRDSGRHHLAPEDHVVDRHRREAQAAGRPPVGDARGSLGRPSRGDAADGVGREDRHANPRQHRPGHDDARPAVLAARTSSASARRSASRTA